MKAGNYDKRFFESTRGRIVTLLRNGSLTVNDLASDLGLTDNAVRAHLLSLERDGIVAQAGMVKGFRKPHYSYALTDEARGLFPAAYDSLFNQLLGVIKGRMVGAVVKDILTEVGRKLGRLRGPREKSFDDRLAGALEAIGELGGAAKVERENSHVRLKSEGCPFAEAVAEHPEVCKVTEAMLSEMVGAPVLETCDRTGSPRCAFEIDGSGGSA